MIAVLIVTGVAASFGGANRGTSLLGLNDYNHPPVKHALNMLLEARNIQFSNDALHQSLELRTSLQAAATYDRTLEWVLCTAGYSIACIAATIFAFYVICSFLSRAIGPRAAALITVVFSMFMIVGSILYYHSILESSGIWNDLIENTIAVHFKSFDHEYLRFDTYGVITIMLLTVASSAVAYSATQKPEPEVIARALYTLRNLLYVGAILLATAVLRLQSLFHWALQYLEPVESDATASLQSTYAAFGRITSEIVTTMGVLYTLLLIAVYAPPAIWLNIHSRRILRTEETAPSAARTDLADSDSWIQTIGKLCALLAPLFAAPLSNLVEHFK